MTSRGEPAPRWSPLAVGAMCVAFATAFAAWSATRHQNVATARFDLGNMTQAVWSAAHGHLLIATDAAGNQVSRLGGHVEPILFLFAPMWRVWSSPTMLLVVQALVVATGAIPAYLLARRWLGDPALAVAFAAVALLYPATQWATLFDFHPVTLATPLLLWAVWAVASDRLVLMAAFLVAALATKEQVGLAVAILGVWIAVSLGRRRVGALVAIGGLAWSTVAIGVVMPHYRSGTAAVVVSDRYGALGDSTGEALRTIVTQPWRALDIVLTADRGLYLLALLLPLAGLSAMAPLLAAGALPDLAINLLSSRPEQHAIEYHYGAVIAPFLIAAAIRGLATLRERSAALRLRPGTIAVSLAAVCLASGYVLGPMPFWQFMPGGSERRVDELAHDPRAATLRAAAAQIPDDVVVSTGNHLGGRLSARRRVLTTPVVGDAEWIVLDERDPEIGDDRDPVAFAAFLREVRARDDFAVVWERDGVVVRRRVSR